MPIFTDHLLGEISIIRLGLNQLGLAIQALSVDSNAASDVRLVLYALRSLFKRNLLPKLEDVLYPALTASLEGRPEAILFDEASELAANSLVRLRMMRALLSLDSLSSGSLREDSVRALSDCHAAIDATIEVSEIMVIPLAERNIPADVQRTLYARSRSIDQKNDMERVHATHVLLNREGERAIG